MMTEKEQLDFTRNLLDKFQGLKIESEDKNIQWELGDPNGKEFLSFSGVDSTISVIEDGVKRQLGSVRGLSFTGYSVDVVDRDKGPVDIALEDVILNMIIIATDVNWLVKEGTFFLEMKMDQKDPSIIKCVEFSGFNKIMYGTGISVDDISTDVSVILFGGKALVSKTVLSHLPEKDGE